MEFSNTALAEDEEDEGNEGDDAFHALATHHPQLMTSPMTSPIPSVRLPSFHVPLSRPSINPALLLSANSGNGGPASSISSTSYSPHHGHSDEGALSAGASPSTSAVPAARAPTLSETIAKSDSVVTMSNPLRPSLLKGMDGGGGKRGSIRDSITEAASTSLRNLSVFFQHSVRTLSGNKTRGSVVELHAQNEHAATAKPCGINLFEIASQHGTGPYSYFVFLAYVALLTLISGIIAAAGYGSVFSHIADTSSLAGGFAGLYPTSAWSMWLGTSLAIVLLPLVGFFFYPFVHAAALDRTRSLEGSEASAIEDQKVDLATISTTRKEKKQRRLVSAALFLVVIGVQAAITFGVLSALSNVRSSFSSLIIAAVNTALTTGARLLVKQLTTFERHRKFSTHRNADALKVLVLRLTNVVVLSALKAKLLSSELQGDEASGASLNSDSITRLTCKASLPSSTACSCPLLPNAWIFFWLWAIDVAVGTIGSPLFYYCRFRLYRAFATKWKLSDYETKAEFDVAEELVATLYRLFLVLQGAAVFPTLTLLGALSFPVKFFADRAKLILLCRKVLQREEPVKLQLLLFCSILTCLAVLFVFPQGVLFVALQVPGYQQCAFSKP